MTRVARGYHKSACHLTVIKTLSRFDHENSYGRATIFDYGRFFFFLELRYSDVKCIKIYFFYFLKFIFNISIFKK